MLEEKFVLYRHTSPSGKVYIGITSKPVKDRWRNNGRGYKTNIHFYNAINKYGWENFKHEVLHENLTKEEAIILERKYIKEHDSFKRGYNRTLGGEGTKGHRHSQSTKNILRTYAFNQKRMTPEQYKKNGEKIKKAWQDPNSRFNDKDFRANRGVKHRGKVLSDETKRKISETLIKNKSMRGENHNQAKKVICLTTQEVFSYCREACEKYNIPPSGMVKCCKNINTYAGKLDSGEKLTWMYYDDYVMADEECINLKIKKAELSKTGKYNCRSKKIICLTTGKIFDYAKEAGEFYNIKTYSKISDVCLGKRKSCGKLPSGEKLEWLYYEDYLKIKLK